MNEEFRKYSKESMKEWNELRLQNTKIYNDYLYNTVQEVKIKHFW